jgi:hypothetical protein
MNANDVIRIGRRTNARRFDRSRGDGLALRSQLFGELDDQDGVLRRQADQHNESDLTEDVVREAAHQLRAQRAKDRERDTEQDDERQHPAFVLRRKHQVHQENTERKNIGGLRAGLDFLERHARPREIEAGWQCLARDCFHLLQRLARADPGHCRTGELSRPEQVEVTDDRGRRRLADGDDGGECHHVAVDRARVSTASSCQAGRETAGHPERRRDTRGC